MIKRKAFLMEGATVVFSLEDVRYIMNDAFTDWVKFGCRGTLEMPTVEIGEFIGHIDEYTKAPVGQFITNRGYVIQVDEDCNVVVIAEPISA